MSTYYQKHFFFCTNQKGEGKKCCNTEGAAEMAAFAKAILQKTGNWGPDKCRVSTSGCHGRCSLGPVLVVYPDSCWYTYSSEEQVQAIIEHHLHSNNRFEEHALP